MNTLEAKKLVAVLRGLDDEIAHRRAELAKRPRRALLPSDN